MRETVILIALSIALIGVINSFAILKNRIKHVPTSGSLWKDKDEKSLLDTIFIVEKANEKDVIYAIWEGLPDAKGLPLRTRSPGTYMSTRNFLRMYRQTWVAAPTGNRGTR